MKKPAFKRGDMVEFAWESAVKVGEVHIMDENGTFEQCEEPSYDIRVPDEGLYKHVPESCVRMPAENDPPERFILRKVKQRRGPVKGKQTYEAMRLCLTAEEAYEAMKILRGGPINVFGQMFFVTYDVCKSEIL